MRILALESSSLVASVAVVEKTEKECEEIIENLKAGYKGLTSWQEETKAVAVKSAEFIEEDGVISLVIANVSQKDIPSSLVTLETEIHQQY